MSIVKSQGASGKSHTLRPAPSIAWSSPTMIPCTRSLIDSRLERSGNGGRPWGTFSSATSRARIRTKRSSRASLLEAIGRAIKSSRRNEPLFIAEYTNGPRVALPPFVVRPWGEPPVRIDGWHEAGYKSSISLLSIGPRAREDPLDTILQLVLNGLAVGCIYGLVALGFVLIYKATELVNFAQGDLLML